MQTELWLDAIAAKLDFRIWLCGHFHIDADCGKYHFLYKRSSLYYGLRDEYFFEEVQQ